MYCKYKIELNDKSYYIGDIVGDKFLIPSFCSRWDFEEYIKSFSNIPYSTSPNPKHNYKIDLYIPLSLIKIV